VSREAFQPDLFAGEAISLDAGVDEVGRGPLVGNVVAAAVILPDDCSLRLADSKRLSAGRREALAHAIRTEALAWSIGEATPAEIDALNILQATFLAMRRAVAGLSVTPAHIWVDGNRCPGSLPSPCTAVVKGDGKVPCISAASILAKVHRDRQMDALHEQYPHYGFDRHRGYPTADHLQAMKRYGLIDGVYRTGFAPVKRLLAEEWRK